MKAELKDKKIKEAIKKIEDIGCSCDVMNGWTCSIHEHIRYLNNLLNTKIIH